jgi:hypothetical protein
MSFAQVKFRIASRRNFDKSDVESVYGELVRVIGGTYFAGGVQQGPANGLLDFRNFTMDAGITNANKANQTSIWPLQIPLRSYTSAALKSTFMPLPWDNLGINPPFTGNVVALTLAYSSMASGTNTGTVSFQLVRQGVVSLIGSAIPWTNSPASATGSIPLGNQTGLSVALRPRDVIRMDFTNNVNTVGIVGIVWISSQHVK